MMTKEHFKANVVADVNAACVAVLVDQLADARFQLQNKDQEIAALKAKLPAPPPEPPPPPVMPTSQ